MTDVILVALVGAIPGTLAAIMSFINSWRLTKIHIEINSRMDQLLAAGRSEAKALGKLEGVDQERKRGGL